MKPEAMLELLEAVAAQLSIKVSYEPLQASVGHGGLCRVKGQYRVIIDKRAVSDERVTTLANALAGFDLEPLQMPKSVRALLRLHRQNQTRPRAA
ncbi:MAG: hypothetical protein IPI49_07165 [Myxococcales bacterium]|nr:hypothetical protein [Myxococcales bacterium]